MGLFDVAADNKEGKQLIKIIVAGGTEKPYFKKKFGMTEKGCFIRIGTAAEPMSQTMIDKLFASRTRNSLGKIKSNRQDLTFEQLKIYYEEKGLTLTKYFKQNLELLTEENKLNYVAYLLADENGTSIKVAKYSGTDRVDLIENNEYGYCSLIKATKRVIDKLELENKTISKITSKERIDTRLWNAVALREAIINAIIHNDYTREIPPKFELFSDRLEITSYGGLFEGMRQADFFDGLSLPRNKELMRIYKDLGMVEHLGSGVPRILQAYDKDCFKFSENYLRMTFPSSEKLPMQVSTQVSMQVSMQVEELIKIFTGEHTRQELQDKLKLANRENFRKNYLQSALEVELIELTVPEKPNSSKQKYRLTEKGILMKDQLS
jgi:ATP-dependent DNA helicase RecG